jgi:DNA-binding MarR family transcriptional regulator
MDDERVPWLSREELRSWLALAAVVEALPPVLSVQLKRDAGINSFDYMVMAGLSESPGRAAVMSDLAAFVAGSISRLSHALSRMEARGWVTRRPLPADGRFTEVVLTDEGMAVVTRAAPGHVREVRRLVVDRLGAERMAQLGEIATRILEVANPAVCRELDHRYGCPSADVPDRVDRPTRDRAGGPSPRETR